MLAFMLGCRKVSVEMGLENAFKLGTFSLDRNSPVKIL